MSSENTIILTFLVENVFGSSPMFGFGSAEEESSRRDPFCSSLEGEGVWKPSLPSSASLVFFFIITSPSPQGKDIAEKETKRGQNSISSFNRKSSVFSPIFIRGLFIFPSVENRRENLEGEKAGNFKLAARVNNVKRLQRLVIPIFTRENGSKNHFVVVVVVVVAVVVGTRLKKSGFNLI